MLHAVLHLIIALTAGITDGILVLGCMQNRCNSCSISLLTTCDVILEPYRIFYFTVEVLTSYEREYLCSAG